MLSLDQIKKATQKVASHYPVHKVLLFGSYAEGSANDSSDIDLLIEFSTNPISLFELAGFNQELREELNISVDTIKLPLKKGSFLDIKKTVCLYEN